MMMLFVASIYSSQNSFPPRYSLNQNEVSFLEEQFIKLQSLSLPRFEEDEQLLINCTQGTDGLTSIKIFMGTFSRENNIVRYNQLYEQHDESKKIFHTIVQFFINQRMTNHLNIGDTMWTSISFEDSTDS